MVIVAENMDQTTENLAPGSSNPVSDAWKNAQQALKATQSPNKSVVKTEAPPSSAAVSTNQLTSAWAQPQQPWSQQWPPSPHTQPPYQNFNQGYNSYGGQNSYNPYQMNHPPSQQQVPQKPYYNFSNNQQQQQRPIQGINFKINPRARPPAPNMGTAWRPRPPVNALSNLTIKSEPSNGNTQRPRQSAPQGQQAKGQSSSGGADQAGEWPPALKAYVTRAFADAKTDTAKDQMEKKLKIVITDAFAQKKVNSIDWSTFPLPQLEQRPPLTMPADLIMPYGGNSSRGRGGKKGRASHWTEPRQRRGKARPDYRSRSRSRTRSRSRSRSRRRSYSRSPRRRRSWSRSSSESMSSRASSDFIPLNSTVSKAIWKSAKKNKKNQQGKSKNKPKLSKKPSLSTYKPSVKDTRNMMKRAARFGDQITSRSGPLVLSINTYADEDGMDVDWTGDSRIVGTCTDLEKQYLRLTSAPLPSQVRPIHILKESITHVQQVWAERGNYKWTCEQFKSIRQDLTVQCIRDEFTVSVYETHARVALEVSDHAEFNQCQAQLKALYAEGVQGHHLEFVSYRILYYIFTQNTIDMISALASLTSADKKDPDVAFALAFRSAWSLNNYHKMIKLYSDSPSMTGYVIDMFLARERNITLKIMIKAYKPTLSLDFVQKQLAFCDSEKASGVEMLKEFLKDQGATLAANGLAIECKQGLQPPSSE